MSLLLSPITSSFLSRCTVDTKAHWSFSDRFFANSQALEQLFTALEAIPDLPDPQELVRQSQAIIHSNTRDKLANIHCPTLILHGDQDLITPIKFAQQLAQGIPQAELVILPETAHGCVIESAQLVTEAIRAFLQSLKT